MDKLFLIAGLGADTRIYSNLDFSGFDVVPVKWIPTDGCVGLESYAHKLAEFYNITPNSIVIGNSLGAMLGVEIAKLIPLKKMMFKSIDFLVELLFGEMEQRDTGLFLDMMRGWSTDFLKWGMTAALQWNNTIIPPNTYHINGDKDLVFPYKKVKDAIVIKGGTHIMIYDMPTEINAVLKKIFKDEIAPIVLPK